MENAKKNPQMWRDCSSFIMSEPIWIQHHLSFKSGIHYVTFFLKTNKSYLMEQQNNNKRKSINKKFKKINYISNPQKRMFVGGEKI